MKTELLTIMAAGGVLLGTPTAHAKPRNEQQREELTEATATLKELEVRDARHITTTELGNAEAWLKEAESHAKRRRTRDDFRRAMERVNAAFSLIEARLEADQAQRHADAVVADLRSTRDELRESQVELDRLTKKREELEGTVSK